MKTSNSGGDFQLAPEGMHIARCFRYIDMGTHHDDKWNTDKRLVQLAWELPGVLMDDERPYVITKRYTASHNERAILRQDLESWYGKTFNTAELDKAGGFDLSKLIGRPCLLNIVHSEDGKYANIKSITPLVNGMNCPDQVNKSFTFDLEPFNQTAFDQLSEKMQAYINECQERNQSTASEPAKKTASAGADFVDDDIPF